MEDLKACHSMDPIHLEKNIRDSLVGLLVGKKNIAAVRHNMEPQVIRMHFHLTKVQASNGKIVWMKRIAPYMYFLKDSKSSSQDCSTLSCLVAFLQILVTISG